MKTICAITIFSLFAVFSAKAQVGVNTSNPDSSAALDIQSPSGGSDIRGVLFPRMTTTQRLSIAQPATSLFVFDTDDMLFYYYDGSRWIGLVPKEPSGTSGPGAPHVNGDITLTTGTIKAPNLNSTTVTTTTATATTTNTTTLVVPGFANNALVPTGVIVMWSGNPNALPTGWALCDGTAGRPDLRGRFIVGYGQNLNPAAGDLNPNYNVGQTGGENMHNLTADESGVPVHTHTTVPHQHDVVNVAFNTDDVNSGTRSDPVAAGNERYTTYTTTATTVIIDPNSAQDAAQPHENRPPYYVLAYIIKL